MPPVSGGGLDGGARGNGGDSSRPVRGARCLARPDGRWGPATIADVLADGTFRITPDQPVSSIMPHWHGVTSAEMSIGDEQRWPPVFERIISDRAGLSRHDLQRTFGRLNIEVDADVLDQFWFTTCQSMWRLDKTAATAVRLDAPRAYAMIVAAGLCARQLADEVVRGMAPRQYSSFYWNQTRMGGRDPSELARTITASDARDALGLGDADADPRRLNDATAFARRHGIELPTHLLEILCCTGIADAVWSSHPNNPEIINPDTPWELAERLDQLGLEGEMGLDIMTPHQGDHTWVAVFDRGERDARVYLKWTEESRTHWQLLAPSLAMFFWDLAQTGLSWFLMHQGSVHGRTIEATPIGLRMV